MTAGPAAHRLDDDQTRAVLELHQLRLFVGVAEELHFSRAAERLFITQPALSRQVRALEQSLGVMLFTRDQRHVALTDAGRTLLEHARRILAEVAAAETAARQSTSTPGQSVERQSNDAA